ncbi:MAG: TIGR00366 family protein [Reichenbachiella sp.]|uniref:YfcC family protein n=1 Tax=Reichenbachiella sp. TaxID=2184521 RepID=UPI002965F399|nr:TIGR00366 family protein [Reichenbachiella sp.]MDW3212031.1 TIGR00366 family protein [Reichenbachiella sp.]
MKVKLPDTLILLSVILILFCGLTWVLPAGAFDRDLVDGREIVVPGSFHWTAANPSSVFDLILAPIQGFIDSAQVIVFIFFVAGAFGIINATGAIANGLKSVVKTDANGKNPVWVIPVLTFLFSLAGATFGMSEEVLVFIMITLPMAYGLGYDSFLGVGIPFLGAGAGFAGAFLNPFTVGIAQGIAGLTPFSGWEYRVVVWLLFTVGTALFLMRYAKRLNANPASSPNYQEDLSSPYRESDKENSIEFTLRQKLIVGLFLGGLCLLIVGVNVWGWYINEISGLFLVLGIVSALLARLQLQKTLDAFVSGASEMVKVCLVIAMAKGIIIIASEGRIIDSMLYGASVAVDGFPKAVSIQLMFYVQTCLNFFLPSGSGQAALTMPIMAPLSDIIGISRQSAVLAFQLGDGLSNMIIPTSGITMGVLTLANISYQKWLKWIWPLMVIYFLLAMTLLIPPVLYFNW